MYNPKFKHVETGSIIDALSYGKDSYNDLHQEWLKNGEIEEGETLPTDEELIDYALDNLHNNSDWEELL